MDLLEDKIKYQAAQLLIKIKELNNATQRIVSIVTESVDLIFDGVLDLLENKLTLKCGEDGALCLAEILEVVGELRGSSVFEGLNSSAKLLSYINEENFYVPPVKEVLFKEEVIRGNKTVEIDVDFGYWVPFIPSLELVLSNPEILYCVDNPKPTQEGVFSSPLDGYFYQNHPVVEEDRSTLAIGTYVDGVTTTDTASSKSVDHGVTFIYWRLLNVYPELSSTSRAIFLLAVVKTSVLKKYGYEKFMADFVAAMSKLYKGVYLTVNGKKRFFHAIFVFNSADNPAAANLAGFKESHFANKPCRQCHTTHEEWFQCFEEKNFPMRTFQSHAEQVQEVTAFQNRRATKGEKDPSITYGINSKSVLMGIPLCDVTKCFPQDLMHDTIEGTLRLEICLLLSHVLEKAKFSLSNINDRITMFSKYFGVNKPAVVEKEHINKRKLRQSAAETLNLAYMLPFVLRKKNIVSGKMELVCEKENLDCFVLRLELLYLLMSRVLTVQDVDTVCSMTNKHHLLFQTLYPDSEIPKLHHEVHYGTHILLYGPPTQFWCFRYEAKHAFFKRLGRSLRTFKNQGKTFSVRHQSHQGALMLLSAKGNYGPYLQKSDSCGAAFKKQLKALPYKQLLAQALPGISGKTSVNQFKTCMVNGVRYHQKSAVITSFSNGVPVFGDIVGIYGCEKKVAFVCKKLKTLSYEQDLKAFKVEYVTNDSNLDVILKSDLVHHHHLPLIKSVGALYICVPCKSFYRSTYVT